MSSVSVANLAQVLIWQIPFHPKTAEYLASLKSFSPSDQMLDGTVPDEVKSEPQTTPAAPASPGSTPHGLPAHPDLSPKSDGTEAMDSPSPSPKRMKVEVPEASFEDANLDGDGTKSDGNSSRSSVEEILPEVDGSPKESGDFYEEMTDLLIGLVIKTEALEWDFDRVFDHLRPDLACDHAMQATMICFDDAKLQLNEVNCGKKNLKNPEVRSNVKLLFEEMNELCEIVSNCFDTGIFFGIQAVSPWRKQ